MNRTRVCEKGERNDNRILRIYVTVRPLTKITLKGDVSAKLSNKYLSTSDK